MFRYFFRQSLSVLLAALLLSASAAPVLADDFKEKPLSRESVFTTSEITPSAPSSLKTSKKFSVSMTRTALALFRETASSGKAEENILLSPDSVITVMAMLENGAKGKTLKELKKSLGNISAAKYNKYLYGIHKRISSSEDVRYDTSNSLWYKKGKIRIKKSYLEKMAGYYHADIVKAPFDEGTVKDMNSWAYNRTQGKISSIIDRLDPSARAVLMNAVYFKGSFAEPFRDGKKRFFTSSSGKKKKVKMLESTENTYLKIGGADGFVKYYKGGQTAFVALLPEKGTDIRSFLKGLSGKEWINGYGNRDTGCTVRTRVPEFSYENKTSLKKPFQKTGIKKAFSGNADFGGMTDQRIAIEDILHKTYIRLDRYGTEAAAVTAVIMKNTSVLNPERRIVDVYLNRPFVYAIVDAESGIPLFIGAVNQIR